MNSEEAYQAIAEEVIAFAGTNKWDLAGVEIEVFEKMASSQGWIQVEGKRLPSINVPSLEISSASAAAAIFLRDDLLRTNKDKIIGIKFQINKQGKFKIDYQYELSCPNVQSGGGGYND